MSGRYWDRFTLCVCAGGERGRGGGGGREGKGSERVNRLQ